MAKADYYQLLDLLWDHPEFTSLEDNPCDAEIIAVGTRLWKQWNMEDKREEMRNSKEPTEITDISQFKNLYRMSDQNRKIIELSLEGKQSAEIAALLSIPVKKVYDIRSKNGLTTQKRHVPSKVKYDFDPEEVAEVYMSRANIAATARYFKVGASTMRKILIRMGLIGGVKLAN